MAVIHDVMPAFRLEQPTSVDDAVALLEQHGTEAWVLAGGMDTFDWLKDRVKRPSVVVDLSGVSELRGIRPYPGGLEIGAMTTLTEVASDSAVRQDYGLLMEAANLVASPQIRNQGTLGGNISQDTRCWYYRGGWSCYRAGGNICYADTPTAMNREHAILGASRCVAVSPSDTAPALVALDAEMVVWGVGLMLSGFFFAFAVLKYGVTEWRAKYINTGHSDIHVGAWWDWSIRLVVLESVALMAWWLYQARGDSFEATWTLLSPFNVGTVLIQFAIALAVLLLINGWLVRRLKAVEETQRAAPF